MKSSPEVTRFCVHSVPGAASKSITLPLRRKTRHNLRRLKTSNGTAGPGFKFGITGLQRQISNNRLKTAECEARSRTQDGAPGVESNLGEPSGTGAGEKHGNRRSHQHAHQRRLSAARV